MKLLWNGLQTASVAPESGAYRNMVEPLINGLEQFQRVAARYEQRAASYQAMLTLAAIRFWR